jgi:hypothetical protein
MKHLTPLLICALCASLLVACKPTGGTPGPGQVTDGGLVRPTNESPLVANEARESRPVVEGARPVAESGAVEAVGPRVNELPSQWEIGSIAREVRPDGVIVHDGDVWVNTPDGTVIRSDSLELTVNGKGLPVRAVYGGNVRLRTTDGGMLRSARAEIHYNKQGVAQSTKFDQVSFERPVR